MNVIVACHSRPCVPVFSASPPPSLTSSSSSSSLSGGCQPQHLSKTEVIENEQLGESARDKRTDRHYVATDKSESEGREGGKIIMEIMTMVRVDN